MKVQAEEPVTMERKVQEKCPVPKLFHVEHFNVFSMISKKQYEQLIRDRKRESRGRGQTSVVESPGDAR